MTEIFIEKCNESVIKIYGLDVSLNEDLYEFFKYKKPGHVRNKFNKWDGTVRLYNKTNGVINQGLLPLVCKFFKQREIEFELDERFKDDIVNITQDELQDWIETLELTSHGNDITPYDYQLESVYLAVKYSKITLLAATSAGKSLISYILARYFELYDNTKTLIIVPRVGLVNQLVDDFKDYSTKNKWDVYSKVHCIYEGQRKSTNKPIIISTWQSLQNETPEYFEQFDNVIFDEVHCASADKSSKIMTMCRNAKRKIGMTGTLRCEDNGVHELQIHGLFGHIKRVITSKELRDQGLATNTQITSILLNYSDEDRFTASTLNYQTEIEFLLNHGYRNHIIKQLAVSLKGNSIFFFDRIESHMLKLYEDLIQITDKKVLMINGSVSPEERSYIKSLIENETGIILLASHGTMSMGESIKNLHNLCFCHPSKGSIRVIQSIGRMLRLHKSKSIANIIDIVDDLSYADYTNHTLNHARKRLQYYKDEQHNVKFKKIDVKRTYESYLEGV